MSSSRISMLCIVVAAIGILQISKTPAQSGWTNGGPVFESDVERRRSEREAARKARRKSYRVTYPKYMKGGAKPDIQPEKPNAVYLDKKEQPGTIIVDTKGRQLYYVLSGNRAYAYPISVGRQEVTIQDLGSLGELIAAVATIVTLAYLAVQIRSNTIRSEEHHV